MSLPWLLKSIDISQYENLDPITSQDLEIIQSEVFTTDLLIQNLCTSFQTISCLVLETIELDNDTKINLIASIIGQIVPQNVEYQWNDDATMEVMGLHRVVFFKLRLLYKILDTELLDENTNSRLNVVLSYYTFDGTPWSDSKLLDLSMSLLLRCSSVEDSLIVNLTSKLSELNKINKFNSNSQKRNKLFQNLNPNIGFFKTSSIELDKWKLENIMIISTLDYLISIVKTEQLQLIVPLLLNFLDDHEVRVKMVSCQLLGKLLASSNAKIISRYNEIFIESLEKCLMYLPPLTPINNSLSILQCAYDNLLLIHKGSPLPLINLIQDNILTSIVSVRDKSFEILEYFLDLLNKLLPLVKHDIIATLSSLNLQLLNILIDPYLVSYQELLVKDIQLMIQLTRFCWPVMLKYKYDYLGGIVLCLKRLQEGKDDLVIDNLKDLTKILSSCCEGVNSDLDLLLEKEPVVKKLTESH